MRGDSSISIYNLINTKVPVHMFHGLVPCFVEAIASLRNKRVIAEREGEEKIRNIFGGFMCTLGVRTPPNC